MKDIRLCFQWWLSGFEWHQSKPSLVLLFAMKSLVIILGLPLFVISFFYFTALSILSLSVFSFLTIIWVEKFGSYFSVVQFDSYTWMFFCFPIFWKFFVFYWNYSLWFLWCSLSYMPIKYFNKIHQLYSLPQNLIHPLFYSTLCTF